MEQEEQLCLKKSGEISVPLWFCLLRERAGRQVPGQEAIHFVWWGLQREAWGVLKADFDPLGPSSLSRSFLGCTVARIPHFQSKVKTKDQLWLKGGALFFHPMHTV